jgi:DNA modification methylase
MAKSEKYYYDASAISEPAVTKDGKSWTDKGRDKQRGHSRRHAGFNGRYADSIAKYGPPQTRNARSVWEITPEPFPDAHFATFPRELSRRCILAGCPEGGLVLDPFAGSGTVGLVAQQTGRNAVLIELNADYCEIARRRLAADAPLLTWPATAPTLATAL